MKNKSWSHDTHDVIAVSFYPDAKGQGGALRESWIFVCKKGDHMNGRYIRGANARAKKIQARSYRFWFAMPRNFAVDYKDECDCCGEPKTDD